MSHLQLVQSDVPNLKTSSPKEIVEFLENISLQDAAEVYGVTRERIHQIKIMNLYVLKNIDPAAHAEWELRKKERARTMNERATRITNKAER